MDVLTFTIVTSVLIILFWAMIDALPGAISEIRLDRQIKRSTRAAEESAARYWAVKDAEETMQIRLTDLPQMATSWAKD